MAEGPADGTADRTVSDRTTSESPAPGVRSGWMRASTGVVSASMLGLLGAILLRQVEVTDAEVVVTRSCGSVFDSVVDRSGWSEWWARDLDETAAVRRALVRTSLCPDAVNDRIALAAVAGVVGLIAGAVTLLKSHAPRAAAESTSAVGRRIGRIGRRTSVLGGVLTILGCIAVVVLVADADSTLFIYVDRLVVGVVGLIVLIPTITLFVIGRVLVLLGDRAEPSAEERADA